MVQGQWEDPEGLQKKLFLHWQTRVFSRANVEVNTTCPCNADVSLLPGQEDKCLQGGDGTLGPRTHWVMVNGSVFLTEHWGFHSLRGRKRLQPKDSLWLHESSPTASVLCKTCVLMVSQELRILSNYFTQQLAFEVQELQHEFEKDKTLSFYIFLATPYQSATSVGTYVRRSFGTGPGIIVY